MATGIQNGSKDVRQASTGELIRRLVDDVDGLVDRQIHLAKQEARENLQTVVGGGKLLGIGVGLLLCALVSLVVLIVALLHLVLPLWAAALIVLGVFAVSGGALTLVGLRKARVSPLAHTRETLREDAEWAKRQLRQHEK